MPLVSVKCIPFASVDPQNFRSFCRFSMLVYDSRVHWRKVSTYMLAHVTTRLLPKSGQLRISYRDLRMSLFSPLLHVPWWLHEVFVRHAALPLFRAADAIYVLCVRSCVRACLPAHQMYSNSGCVCTWLLQASTDSSTASSSWVSQMFPWLGSGCLTFSTHNMQAS